MKKTAFSLPGTFAAALCAALLIASQTAFAATFTFTPPAAGTASVNWSVGTYWDATPVSGIDTQLIFGGTLNASTTVVSNDDISSPPFQLNNLTFNAAGPASGTAPIYTIQGTQLEFVTSSGSATPTLTLSATGTVKPSLTISNNILLTNDLAITANPGATLSGVISGASNLAISGGGTVNFNNSSNTFGGVGKTITVSGGSTIRTTTASGQGAFGNTSNKIVLNGGGLSHGAPSNSTAMTYAIEFQTGGTNTITAGGGSAGRNTVLGGALTGTGGFTINQSSNATVLGITNLTGGSDTLGGTVTTGTNSLYVSADASRDALGAAALIMNGQVLFGGTSVSAVAIPNFSRAITVNTGSGLSASNNYTFTHTGTLTGSANLSINNAASPLTGFNLPGASSVIVLNGDMSGFSGGLSVSNGTLRFGSAATMPTSFGQLTLANTAGVNADLNGRSITVGGLATGGATGGNIQGNSTGLANTLTIDTTAGSTSYAGIISNGGSVALNLTKTGSNTQTLSGTNTYTGATTISGGTLRFTNNAAGSSTASVAVNNAGSTLAVNYGGASDFTETQLNTLLAKTTFGATTTALAFDTTNLSGNYSTALTLAAGITKLGSNTLTLSGDNTYTGATTVSAGVLKAGVASILNTSGAFGLNSAVTTTNVGGVALDIAGFDTQIGSLAGGGGTGGNVTLGSNTLTIGGNNTSTSFAGIISGTGGVVKIGTGTQTLTGANTFSTGGLTIKSGTISGSVASAFGTGTITLGDSSGSADATLFTSANSATHANNIVVQAGSSGNTLKIDGSGLPRTFSGTVALNNNLVVDNQGLSQVNTFSGLVTEAASSALTLTKGSGVGNVTFSGGIAVGSGGLTLANNAVTTGLLTVTGGVSGTGNLILNNNGVTASGISLSTISVNNSGTITNSGTGSGSTSISAATGASVTGITENSATSALTVSGALTVNSSGTTLTNNNASGSSLLTLSGGTTGSGNLIINNNSSIANGVTISGTNVNNTGTVTNSGTNSGNALISSIIGTNVTGVYQNSTTSALNLSGVNTFTNNGTTTFGLNILAGTVNALTSASSLGAGAVTLGNTSGTSAASLIVGTTGLSFGNAIVLATNPTVGTLTIGTSGNFSTTFTGGVTGSNSFTINSGGTQPITFSTGALNNAGTITNASTGTIASANGIVISSSVGSNVTGIIQNSATGAMTLTGNNSAFAGNVSVSNGSLRVGNLSALSSANTVSVNNVSGAVFDLNNFDQTIAGLNSVAGAGTGNVNNTGAANKILTLGGSGTYNYSGSISPTTTSRIALTKTGSGFQTLSGTNTFTGKTTISGGTLAYGQTASLYNSAAASWTAANITVGSGATIGFNVGGTGEFTAANLNTLLTNISVAGAGTGLQAGARLAFDTTNASGGTFTQGNVIANSTGANGGAIGLTKLGTNTLDLDKANTYTGATTVSGGTLLVSGTGSINNTSGVTVNTGGTFRYNSSTAFTQSLTLDSGATLAGSGNLGAVAFTVGNGSTISPGNSPGTMSTGTQTWLDGGNYNFQLLNAGTTPTNAIAGTDYDTVAITGGLNLASLTGSPDFNINLWTLSSIGPDVNGNALNFNGASNYTWTLVSTTTGITGFNVNNFTINTAAFNGTSGFSNSFTGSFSLATAGNNLVLNYTAIPEPNTVGMLLGGFGLLIAMQRRGSRSRV